MSLLIRFPFFGDTGLEGGKLTAGRIGLPPGASLVPLAGKSSYFGQTTTSRAGSALIPQRNQDGVGVRIRANRS